jgi:hypothetical protein
MQIGFKYRAVDSKKMAKDTAKFLKDAFATAFILADDLLSFAFSPEVRISVAKSLEMMTVNGIVCTNTIQESLSL